MVRNASGVRNLALLWAVTTGLVIVFLNQMAWWHPACSVHQEGTIDFGYGFPLPYWTYVIAGATSAGFIVMPHVFVLNIAILAAIAYPLYRLLVRRVVSRSRAAGTILLVAGLLLFLLELTPIVLGIREFAPRRSIAPPGSGSTYSESYFSFQPAFLAAREGKRSCPA